MDTIITKLVEEVQGRSRFVLGLIEAVDNHKATMNWDSKEDVEQLETLREMRETAENQLRSIRQALVCMRQARGDKNIDVFYPEMF